VRPVALEIDREDRFPLELFKRAGELGLLGITVEEKFGGMGADYTTLAIVMEEIAKASPVLCVAMGAHAQLAGGMISMLGTEEQKLKYLVPASRGEIILACGSTESAGGANHEEHTTRAVLDGDEWVINGGKVLISNIGVADLYVLLAITSDHVDPGHQGRLQRVPRPGRDARPGGGRTRAQAGLARFGDRQHLVPGPAGAQGEPARPARRLHAGHVRLGYR